MNDVYVIDSFSQPQPINYKVKTALVLILLINIHYNLFVVSTLRKPNIASTNVWNSLPLENKQLESKSICKIKLKEYLLEKCNTQS